MIINVITLFPEAFTSFLEVSIVSRARKKGAIEINFVNLRDFGMGNYHQVDDYPYGGGAGMVLRPEPILAALKSLHFQEKEIPVIFFTPQAPLLKQTHINRLCQIEEIIIICGHYKGIDQRIRDAFVTEEFSIGDYVLSGGELPAMVLIDAVARLQDEVLGDMESALTDSHQDGLLGCPQYTRPSEFEGLPVPQVLLNGNHKLIAAWRENKAWELTRRIRPDLLDEE
ncbi:MAG: tRNA (guanosine(37)-N1)-methyltransferase TrmD [Candidatus Cloacimonetes bacterium]|nr:tRNA (guanosine(37)-N1)-methyltransferase TrmD [Candidatus Cloacimonadota bacterium]